MRPRNHSRELGVPTLLVGLGVGLAAGVAAALLTAPMRGRELRSTLRRQAADGGVRLQSLASTGWSWAQQILDRGRELIEQSHQEPRPLPLRATVGEIASTRSSHPSQDWGALS